MLKISVAMTSYNGEKFIKTQLSSLLKQIRKPDEVIIVDDVSTDNTVEIIKDFITENGLYDWKLTVNEENLGFKQNFKKALSLATGDIIFLCDQDDDWCEDTIASISSNV
ncbi:MAG: glycosyltransferase [Clostridia bacterium]|nr:glycosyltransferase [Clostridia bacterium]